MSTLSVLRADITAAIAAADGVTTRALAEEYTTMAEVEADIMGVRALIAPLLPRISTQWGADGHPLHASLRQLAARLLDLQTAVGDDAATVEEETDRPTSLIELAVRHYQDFGRWTDLALLNPNLSHPGSIPAGTTVVRYVR